MRGRKPPHPEAEKRFIETMAVTRDKVFSAHAAGYPSPAQRASELMQRPHVVAGIRAAQERRLNDELLPAAIGVIETIMMDAAVKPNVRLQAAKIVVDRTLGAPGAAGEGKAPEDMTPDELAQRIAFLRSMQADRANPVLEAEPLEESEEKDVFG